MIRHFTCLCIAIMLIAGCTSTSKAPTAPRLHIGVDRHSMSITTNSPEAQRWFDQGLQFTYGFFHSEAIRSYERAAEIDPAAPMPWWGIAYALGPNINYPAIDPATHARAYRAAQEALARIDNATPREAALINAIAARYILTAPADPTPLNEAFVAGMRKAHHQFPDDPDICALYAESMMDLQPWNYWDANGTPIQNTSHVLAVLERAIQLDPTHPGAHHLYIHAMESGPDPERAVPSGDVLRARIPGSGHIAHMPSHIYAVVGRYADAADVNELAIAADLSLLEGAPDTEFYWGYYGHNLHFLAYAAMMECRYDTAMRAARQLWRDIPDGYVRAYGMFVEGIVPTTYHVMIRFGRWHDILAEPTPPAHYIVSTAVHHYARSIANSALGRVDDARTELEAFELAAAAIPGDWLQFNNRVSDILPIARAMIHGELLYREGKLDEAFAILRDGAIAEDSLVYDEPPGWMVPIRHALGALLMGAGRHAEAEVAYREDLERNINNGWGLLGLELALRAQNKNPEEADALAARRAIAWKRADVVPTSSCFCQPGQRSYH